MLAAALVPDTVLTLPGAAGRAPAEAPLVALREAAATAVARAVTGAHRVVVVAPAGATRALAGPVVLGAGATGVPDHLLADPPPRAHLTPAPGGPAAAPGAPGAGAVVGARAALAAGASVERLHVVEVAPQDPDELRALGARLRAAGTDALVVVGSGAARHGDAAPLPADPRAPGHDAATLAALRAGDATALGSTARDLAAELAVTGWAPWQVLVGALGPAHPGDVEADVLHADVWRGAGHAAAVWRVVS